MSSGPAPRRRGDEQPAAGAVRYTGLALGVALLAGLVVYHGAGDVAGALARAGPGLVLIALFHLIPIALDAIGWACVVPPAERPGFAAFLVGRWVCYSVNSLLPVMQVGGNVARARLLARRGMTGVRAAASVVVDVTTIVSSQVVFAVLGLALLAVHLGPETPVVPVVAGVVFMAALVVGFYLAQRRGLFGGLTRGLERVVRLGDWLTASAEAIDHAVRQLYGRRRGVVAATIWHVVSWIAGAGEVWLALRFLGHPVGLATALLLESLGQAVRSSAFLIPGALGVQEAGYLVLGRAVHLDPDTALALSLAQRVRDVLLGVPGLLVWWWEDAAVLPRRSR